MTAPATPKPQSAALRELYQRICEQVDAPTLVVLLYASLERKRLEGLYTRFAPRQGPRVQGLAKEELVGAVAGWFFSSLDVAHAVIRELDRVASKERHIVASLPDASIAERLERYQALDFRRERAKLVWALLRDDRAEAHGVASEVSREMVALAQGDVSEAVPAAGADDDSRLASLRDKLASYENGLQEVKGRVKGLQGQVQRLERERAELIVTIGRKESALRAEESQRRAADEAVLAAQRTIRELEHRLAAIGPDEVQRLAEERSQLEQKLRRLEKKAEHTLETERLRDERDALRLQIEELEGAQMRSRDERQQLLQTLVVRDRATQERLSHMREALKAARRMTQTTGDAGEPTPRNRDERLGIFVDAANVSASAKRAHGSHFDFHTVLALAGDRERVVTLAYVVDNGQPGFQAFASALRQMGFTVKVKKPSVRPDGSIKADWDMAIAMDIVEARHRVDTVLIASGDGDFVPLVRRLKRWRKRIEVTAFDHAIHPELKRTADAYWPLGAQSLT
ncbi:MAG: NYN domain-containing protein [Pseudomonadota bacterium]